ncbi:MAG: 23S rRNA (uracil(1939)-C(5))-methyltransferase RlmD [Gammaproteobacteria bacterium]|nr:23S rRNA (uracil(1939)-C(5))-methyltransferase RlmD [Gammaproteobacteria bacterium]
MSRRQHATPPTDDRPATKRGDVTVATVESLTHDARGVARIDGKTTFIEGALPGEQVRFRYHNKYPRYDTGAVQEVLSPSPERVTPPCPHFNVCGGCSLQHMSPTAQLDAKQRVLAETLEHVGKVQPERWLAPISGPVDGYRRRARLGVRYVSNKGGALVGFRERRSSFITPLTTCLTLDPRAAALLPAMRALVTRLSRPNRIPQIEVAASDDQLALVLRHLEPLTDNDRAQLRDFAAMYGVTMYVQPGGTDTMALLWPESPPALVYALPAFDLQLAFTPVDFVQVNAAVNRMLVELAVTLLDVKTTDRVLDLFCGLGNFTLALARRAAQVVGIEADVGLIERARANAQRNGLSNVEFRTADLFDDDAPASWTEDGYQKLLLDPPRAGAIEVIKRLPASNPGRIVYVSCNPATLARDSDYLVHQLGFRLEAAGVADMFPHTSHVESIALFTRS